MDLQLTGSRVLVTGGTRGIGRAIVEAFVDEGAAVEFCARDAGEIEATEKALAGRGPGVRGVQVDVRDGAALRHWVEAAAERLGGLDAVVANVSALADPGHRGELVRLVRGRPDAHGAPGARRRCRTWRPAATARSWRSPASPAGRRTSPPGPYGTMKTAIVRYISGLAFQLAGRGVRANVVSPGNTYFEGGVWQQIEQGNPDLFATPLALNPTGRMGTPEEMARAVVFLSSPVSSLHDRHAPGRRRRADPRHPALIAVLGRRALGRATLARQLLLERVRHPVTGDAGAAGRAAGAGPAGAAPRAVGPAGRLRPGRTGRSHDVAGGGPDPADAHARSTR